MGIPAAKQTDRIVGVDTHIILVPSPGGPVPTPLPHPFSGTLLESLSTDVFFDNLAAATVGSVGLNVPPHIPQGGTFQTPPNNRGTIERGSTTVTINGKGAARLADPATSCNDIGMKYHSQVVTTPGAVFIGNGGPDSAALKMPWA